MTFNIANYYFMAFALIFFSSNVLQPQASEEIEDPALLFDSVLASALKPDETKKLALAHLYERIPEKSTHEKELKEILAERFQKKFGVDIKSLLAPKIEIIQWPVDQARLYHWWLFGGGASALATLIAYLALHGRQQVALPTANEIVYQQALGKLEKRWAKR